MSLTLDLRHLRCPLPVLRTRKALRSLAEDDLLVVQCTDPLAGIDIPHLLTETGDALISAVHEGETLVFTIRKAAPASRPPEDPPAY